MEQSWNADVQGRAKILEKSLSQYYFCHHRTQTINLRGLCLTSKCSCPAKWLSVVQMAL